MKKLNANLAIILLTIVGCTGCNQSGSQTDEIITVDVTASYPEKELILQDFMDVEYIPLETSDEFITHGIVEAVGKNVLLIRNRNDGNIFVFDRTGKGIRKINRLGQGLRNIHRFQGLSLMRITTKSISKTILPEKYWCMTCPVILREVSNLQIPVIMMTYSIMTGII